MLLNVLRKYESLFDGTLGKWAGKPYKIALKENQKPYHTQPFLVPKAYEDVLKAEVKQLCSICVLKRVNHSEWASLSFIVPKKDDTVRFIMILGSYTRGLRECLILSLKYRTCY